MKAYLIILTFLLLYSSAFAQNSVPKNESPPNGHNSPYQKSLKDLLADPAYYNNEPVRVNGYLIVNKTVRLYLSTAAYKKNKVKKSIIVHISTALSRKAKQCSRHYVTIQGVFHSSDNHEAELYTVNSLFMLKLHLNEFE